MSWAEPPPNYLETMRWVWVRGKSITSNEGKLEKPNLDDANCYEKTKVQHGQGNSRASATTL